MLLVDWKVVGMLLKFVVGDVKEISEVVVYVGDVFVGLVVVCWYGKVLLVVLLFVVKLLLVLQVEVVKLVFGVLFGQIVGLYEVKVQVDDKFGLYKCLLVMIKQGLVNVMLWQWLVSVCYGIV